MTNKIVTRRPDSKPPASVFYTKDYEDRFPDLRFFMAEVSFPTPFTVGLYRKWYRALRLGEEPDSVTDAVILLRQYEAALAVCDVTAVEPTEKEPVKEEGDDDPYLVEIDEEPVGRAALDLTIIDPKNPGLPLSFVSFLVAVADEYIGPKISVETMAALKERRLQENYRSALFRFDHCPMFPDMWTLKGYVKYRDPLTSAAYKSWVKAREINDRLSPRDVDNSPFLRQLRGAAVLVQKFHFKGLRWEQVTADDFENMPLHLASFLVETADVFLSRRMTLKNSPVLPANGVWTGKGKPLLH